MPAVLRLDPVESVVEKEIRVQLRCVVNRTARHGDKIGVTRRVTSDADRSACGSTDAEEHTDSDDCRIASFALRFESGTAGVVATVAMPCDPRRQPFVDDFRSFPKGCRRRPWHRSLFTGGVFLAAQHTVMIQIASGEVLAEPLVALDVILGQLASPCGIQGIETWARGGFPHGAVSCIVVRAHRDSD